MDVSVSDKGVYVFGPFRLDPVRRTLMQQGAPVKLAARLFDTLLYLIEAQGRLVEKDELLAAVWSGRIVEEGNLPQTISMLRKTLQADGTEAAYIATVPGRGYRFASPVRTESGAPDLSTLSTPSALASPFVPPASAAPATAARGLPWWRRRAALPLAALAFCVVAALAIRAPWPHTAAPPLPSAPAFAPPPHSVAVLAFTNMSGDPADDYFADGLAEELINTLARLPDLRVAARVSAFSFKGKTSTIADIARSLNVGTVLEGSVRRGGGKLRIAVQLVDAKTGFQLWARSFDRDAHDLLALEGDIAGQVAGALSVSLGQGAVAHATSGGTSNPAAFDLYLRAMTLLRSEQDDAFSRAVAMLDQAVALDPLYARAYAARAIAQANRALTLPAGTPPKTVSDLFQAALASADKAIALAPDLVAAHGARGFILDNGMNKPAEAFEEAARARALEPNNGSVEANYAQIAVDLGRFQEAVAAARRAATIDPLRPEVWYILGDVLYRARHFDESLQAVRHEKTVRGTLPENSIDTLARAQLLSGDAAGAEKSCAGVGPEFTDECFALAEHALGKLDAAKTRLAHMHAQGGDTANYSYAQVAAQWGDKQAALTWLEKALPAHDPMLAQLLSDPLLDPISGEPRFKAVVRQMNFPP
jgi:TolB-like protein/DNA-binding winged helix-turn-helix (wHTH) protein/tetratricopeptide (TPR) repeat protein